MPLTASIFITTPAATTVAAEAEAIKSGLAARSMILCDFTVDIEVGATVGTAVLPAVLVSLVVGDLAVVLVLGFVVLAVVGVLDDELAVPWLLVLGLDDFLDEPPEEPDEPPLEVGAAVGVTPGT